jgi:ribonuclease HI
MNTPVSSERPNVTITTDGAVRGNPGPGGWAALLEFAGREKLLSGEAPATTTNNAMEIYAVAAALEALKRPCHVTLRADSQYVIDGLQRLLAGGPLPEKNRDLWQRLRDAAQPHDITFHWVRGHNGDARNERVDRAANAAANRAYVLSEQPRSLVQPTAEWTLAICSPSTSRPVLWALVTPATRRSGSVPVVGMTQPTAVYQALVQGLTAAQQLDNAADAALTIVSNYELIIKQGRGEWQVKKPEQQALARQVADLRTAFAQVSFTFDTTERVLQIIEA